MSFTDHNPRLHGKTDHVMNKATDGSPQANNAVNWHVGQARSDIRYTDKDGRPR